MMNVVGCDVCCKRWLDVFLNGKHCRFENDINGIGAFVLKYNNLDSSNVILEPTGGYERNLVKAYMLNNIAISIRALAKALTN